MIHKHFSRFNRWKIINTENGEILYKATKTVRQVVMLLILRKTLRNGVRIREDSETDNSQEADPGKNDRFERGKNWYKWICLASWEKNYATLDTDRT